MAGAATWAVCTQDKRRKGSRRGDQTPCAPRTGNRRELGDSNLGRSFGERRTCITSPRLASPGIGARGGAGGRGELPSREARWRVPGCKVDVGSGGTTAMGPHLRATEAAWRRQRRMVASYGVQACGEGGGGGGAQHQSSWIGVFVVKGIGSRTEQGFSSRAGSSCVGRGRAGCAVRCSGDQTPCAPRTGNRRELGDSNLGRSFGERRTCITSPLREDGRSRGTGRCRVARRQACLQAHTSRHRPGRRTTCDGGAYGADGAAGVDGRKRWTLLSCGRLRLRLRRVWLAEHQR